MKRLLKWMLAGLLLLIIAAVGVVVALNADDNSAPPLPAQAATNPAEQISRGAYLVRGGDCMACHTARGGKELAGGRAIQTPFGAIYAPNLTPDQETGIGSWSADDFWQALHNGKSKDGSLLYPAFPYTNYTKVTRSDADAMFAYLRSVPAVQQKNRQHDLRFPYNNRFLLYGWRALYFRPGVYQDETQQSVEWNRGAYLVQGLGHCSACHTTRNALGGTDLKADLGGGFIPVVNWYAPSLTSDQEIGLGDWDIEHITGLLKNGVSPRGTVLGPMAEVVGASLQHLSDQDVRAMAVYLKSLPRQKEASELKERASPDEVARVMELGQKIYKNHCIDCHQASGKGQWPAYPPLASNHAITMPAPVNAIRVVLNGGFAPSTAANPRPYGMPPYGPALSDSEVAAVVSYIRNSWGNKAPIVSAAEVNRYRAVPLD
ncbi:cytochrome c family protein [Collimonas fungivorans]|uniref:Cytochrome c family protein n=1 Tax=Collimonas fungivorans TaxID=158899 RepID=A0A127PG98_9BURK|nr:cytochrome c [Collimonas fungivorans]AMO96819.1 cytochrome c family protein [Collimonas fungivorans]